MSYYGEMTDQYLDNLYEEFQKEQQKILQDIKSGCDSVKEINNNRKFNILNALMANILKLRNLNRKIKSRMDM